MSEPVLEHYDLAGLVDMHIHSAPDVQPRYADDIDVVRQAQQAGMRAVLLKSHVTLTSDRAAIAEKVVGKIRVFGGLALNDEVGGLNPAAVEAALQMGAKEIWMPTRSAAAVRRQEGKPGGITLFADSGALRPEVYDIIDLIAAADAILATGHVSPAESVALASCARQRGVRKILVTHPEAAFIRMPVEIQASLAKEGVFFERCYVDTTPLMDSAVKLAEIANRIRRIGAGSTVLSTDFGQLRNPSPMEGMRAYLTGLSIEGFRPQEIQKMAGENPSDLLGLS
jgi:hypothetical protein